MFATFFCFSENWEIKKSIKIQLPWDTTFKAANVISVQLCVVQHFSLIYCLFVKQPFVLYSRALRLGCWENDFHTAYCISSLFAESLPFYNFTLIFQVWKKNWHIKIAGSVFWEVRSVQWYFVEKVDLTETTFGASRDYLNNTRTCQHNIF